VASTGTISFQSSLRRSARQARRDQGLRLRNPEGKANWRGRRFKPFNAFTETPVRGQRSTLNPTVNYDLGPDFGKPTSAAGYQLPRTFRVSVGLRF